ncbi:uncharacterized protein LOC134176236 [Corticium candelabrum]|uniref:uncharacterized protein LOC134176236 n=1 Tax=Corticium candelabrum TaxID=121492 RepID=UPI002E277201|nr:uncharacterized protein LOC134176236 [Corticium candelabrum]
MEGCVAASRVSVVWKVYMLKDVCDNDHRKWFLNFCCQMATLNQGNANLQMLVTAPKTMVMTLFAEAHNFEHELLVTLPRLVTDQHPKVRRTVASGFYEEVVPSAHVDIQVGALESFSLLLENKQLTVHVFHSMLDLSYCI